MDVDFSMCDEFKNLEELETRIFRAIRDRFDSAGYVVFDERILEAPAPAALAGAHWWGGYQLEFELISRIKYDGLGGDLQAVRRNAQTIDAHQRRRFRIDISKHEFCEGKEALDLDGYTIYVYTPTMCVIEKLQAICQQMPDYVPVPQKTRTPRVRDFYDAYTVLTRLGIDLALPENLDLFRSIFAAKEVPLRLLGRIDEFREFHRPDWDAVRDTIVCDVFEFDFYFDFVVSEVAKLQALWVE